MGVRAGYRAEDRAGYRAADRAGDHAGYREGYHQRSYTNLAAQEEVAMLQVVGHHGEEHGRYTKHEPQQYLKGSYKMDASEPAGARARARARARAAVRAGVRAGYRAEDRAAQENAHMARRHTRSKAIFLR